LDLPVPIVLIGSFGVGLAILLTQVAVGIVFVLMGWGVGISDGALPPLPDVIVSMLEIRDWAGSAALTTAAARSPSAGETDWIIGRETRKGFAWRATATLRGRGRVGGGAARPGRCPRQGGSAVADGREF